MSIATLLLYSMLIAFTEKAYEMRNEHSNLPCLQLQYSIFMSRPIARTISSRPIPSSTSKSAKSFKDKQNAGQVSTADATKDRKNIITSNSSIAPVKKTGDQEIGDSSVIEELRWKTLVLGHHYPEDFDSGRWISLPGDSYPIDIVIGLEQVCNVYKVLLEVDDNLLPSKVDISVGLGDATLPITYKNAREANFKRPVTMEYFKRERSRSRMETKTAFMDKIGQYLWLQINEPLKHLNNKTGQIKILNLTILGYRIVGDEYKEMLKKTTIDGFRPNTRDGEEYELYNEMARNIIEEPKESSVITRHSYNGDGLVTTSNLLASDPLTTLRTVKNTLEQKRDTAKRNGRDVEATVCHRAIQRLLEYEVMVEDLHTRRSNALVHGDLIMAERHRLAMVDCRDTALRSTHVDLLLDRAELRAIGASSEWSEKQ